jgi:Uma2 family endonuclease
MSTTTERMRVEDYYVITVEGDRKQLVDGAIVVNDPTIRHGVLQTRILVALVAWCDEPGQGLAVPPTDVMLSDHDLYGPDISWVRDPDPPLNARGMFDRLPDLCVEVRSPSTWRHDLGAKRRGYERGGLPELWLVDDEEQRVIVLRRSRPDAATFDIELELRVGDVLASPQLPGFALLLADLFRP